MRNYYEYVDAMERAMRDAEKIPPASVKPCRTTEVRAASPLNPVLIISPHPDDEMLVGALALRFKKQCGVRVINISTTLGSNRQRQAARWLELKAACDCIGFEAQTFGERGLEHITPEARKAGGEWSKAADAMADAIAAIKPSAIFFPHALDANRTHMGVHLLALDALVKATHACVVFETEFWAPMTQPNLSIESAKEDVAELVTALAQHVGEVSRNPYHLRLPAWMMDNVRRGGELVGGQGGAAPDFTFATLYRRAYWNGREMAQLQTSGSFVGKDENPAFLLDIR
jgi:N-acetylglucosamine malate deacetylase 1